MRTRRPLPVPETSAAPPLPSAIADAVGYLVNEVAARFRLRFERTLAQHRLRRHQYHMMVVLRDEAPIPQQALGQRVRVDRTTTMHLVQDLVDAGLVARRDDPADRRAYVLSLTPAGRRLTATLEGHIKRAEQDLLAPLASSERQAFARHLRTILAAHGDAP